MNPRTVEAGVPLPLQLTVIIVSWNTLEFLERCLRSIPERFREAPIETIVIDNASTDGSPEMVHERFPSVRLVRNSDNVGFAAANNQGLVQSTGRYVLLLNSDAEVTGEAIEKLVAFLDQHQGAGAAGPQLVYPDGSLQFSHARFPGLVEQLMLAFGFGRFILPDESSLADETDPRQVDYVAGACLLLRADAYRRIGGLDERFFMYSEETDWCYRLRDAGWEVWFVPSAEVTHVRGGSTRRVPTEMLAQLYRGRVLFARKHHGSAYAFAMKLVMVFDIVLRIVVHTARSCIGRGASTTRSARDYARLLRRVPAF